MVEDDTFLSFLVVFFIRSSPVRYISHWLLQSSQQRTPQWHAEHKDVYPPICDMINPQQSPVVVLVTWSLFLSALQHVISYDMLICSFNWCGMHLNLTFKCFNVWHKYVLHFAYYAVRMLCRTLWPLCGHSYGRNAILLSSPPIWILVDKDHRCI